ncbi:MAG: cysteine--tRNA ligase [Waddliaceae bacterium]
MAAAFDATSLKLRFFNTEARAKEQFKLSQDRPITLYTCGPTVYDYAHIGNYRTYVFEDLLRRTLQFFGFRVIQVMNLTDVDDKTIKGAIKSRQNLEAYIEPFVKAFFEDLKTLNIEPAEHYPAATAFIDTMIEMIQALLDKGIAYQGGDGSIYYSLNKFPRYGCLSHLKIEDLKAGASERVSSDEYEKENVSDFVLWKKYDQERDGHIYWDSPFGPGRPGWHLECSAMAMKILGETVDIHCGGVDNIFPHHENEIAQSEAISGVPFVKLWLHSEHLIVNGKKMSKSLGNFYTLRDLLQEEYTGLQIRYMLLQTHYRTQLNFTFDELGAVKHAMQRLNDFMIRMQEIDQPQSHHLVQPILEKSLMSFAEGLADDLNISAALASVFDMVRDIHGLCDKKQIGEQEAKQVLDHMRHIDKVLGILTFDKKEEEIPSHLLEALEKRNAARREKDWAAADQLRDEILSQGYQIEDTPAGARLKKVGR